MNLAGLGLALAAGGVEIEERLSHMIEKVCVLLEDEAKRVLGTYDYGWPPLAPETIASKATDDSPLLETGALRDSITHNLDADGKDAYVGTDIEYAKYQEYGTSRIPARSFLGGALHAKEKELIDIFGHGVVKAIGPK
jgi:HK97 gp10 family phage protein